MPVICALGGLVLVACGGDDGPPPNALGEEVVVTLVTGSSERISVGITPTAVRTGSIEEMEAAGFVFDDDERDLTPYYVDVTYRNAGDAPFERTTSVTLEDGDGNLISSTIITDLGGTPFEDCPNVRDGEVAPGEEFADCTLFLVDGGTDVDKVTVLDSPADGEPEFVYWSAGS